MKMSGSNALKPNIVHVLFVQISLQVIFFLFSTAQDDMGKVDINIFFSAIRAFSQKFGVTQQTQHRLYSHNTFLLQMSQI